VKKLYNTIDSRVLKEQIQQSKEERTTLSFYKYQQIGNPNFFRDYLFLHWAEVGVLGRVYVSQEGINAQISVLSSNYEAFKEKLSLVRFFKNLRLNEAIEDDGRSFFKLKIKVRDKIVADGLNDDLFDVTDCGTHLNANEFNELTDKPDTLLIDMRNHYESEIGHFEGAITPDVDTFREELEVVEKMIKGKENDNIVMYCTGGIRCEKATAWFKHKGFKNLYQLDGGIINYSRQVLEEGVKNKFKGKNFVFDERLAERISEEIISQCHQCGAPADAHTNCKNVGCNLLFIQCENCKEKYDGCCKTDCQTIAALPEEEQKEIRKGQINEKRYFKKGRSEHLKT